MKRFVFKKIFAVLISSLLISNQAIFAAETVTGGVENFNNAPGSGEYIDAVTANGEPGKCKILHSRTYFPVGDTLNKSVLTKKEVVRECIVTKRVPGKCIKWEDRKEEYGVPQVYYDTYETNYYGDTIGTLMATLGAYDQIDHIWSGWHGFCYIGTKVDFSWAKNPFFWASLAMSIIMQGSQDGKFLANTEFGKSVQAFEESLGNAMGDFVNSAGSDIVDNAATEAAKQAEALAYTQAVEQANGTLLSQGAQEGIRAAAEAGRAQFFQNLGTCLVAAGFNVSSSLYEFLQDDGSGLECDPVDEVCDEDAKNDLYQDEIYTADATTFHDMIDEWENAKQKGETDIDIYDYIEIIKEEDGVVTFRYKKASEIPGVENIANNNAEMEKLRQKMKLVRLGLSTMIEAAKVAGCMGGYISGTFNVPTSSDAGLLSAESLASKGFSFLSKWMGPYGPLINAAFQIALKIATSFKDVDTCHDEDDAKEAGKRHERTNYSLQFNLCHFVKKKCVDSSWTPSNFFGSDCILWGYHYCCYDQVLSKVLVEQLKAQLGRSWEHCTGITLRDLNYVSFRSCTEAEKADGTDGAKEGLPENYDPKTSFQYKHKCIDLTEFKNYLQSELDTDIDMGWFNQFWDDLGVQAKENQ